MIHKRIVPYCLLVVLVSLVTAQVSPDEGSSLAPDFLTRHGAVIIEDVGIKDVSQQAIILQLIDDYDAMCAQSRSSLAKRIRNLPRSGIDNRIILESFSVTKDFLEQKHVEALWLRDNIQLILTDEQQPRFQSALRRITRQRLLPKGGVPGANIDLIVALQSTPGGHEAMQLQEVNDTLDAWILDIDAALSDREAFDVSNGIAFRTLITEERWQDALDWRTAWLQSHLRVRDITIQAAREVLPFLDGPSADQLSIAAIQGGANLQSKAQALASRLLEQETIHDTDIREAVVELRTALRPLKDQLIELQLATAGLHHLRPLRHRLGVESEMEKLESKQVEVLIEIRRVDDMFITYFESLAGQ